MIDIIITMQGGILQCIHASCPDVRVAVVEYDDEADPEELSTLSDGSQAIIYAESAFPLSGHFSSAEIIRLAHGGR